MRHGVAKDGRALFDFMPFQHLSNEDMIAIVSYLRSQPAVSHAVPKADLNLMGKAVKAFVMQPVGITAPLPTGYNPIPLPATAPIWLTMWPTAGAAIPNAICKPVPL